MDLQQRKVYRKEQLGLTFSESKGETGTLIGVQCTKIKDVFNEMLTPPDVLTEVFRNFGIAFSQIKKHNL